MLKTVLRNVLSCAFVVCIAPVLALVLGVAAVFRDSEPNRPYAPWS